MKLKKRAQISTEYLIIVSFLTFVTLSVLGVALFYTSQIKDTIKFNQIEQFANKLITSAESVYFAGEPSKLTLTAYVPEGVTSIIISDNAINFVVGSQSGTNIISYSSDVPLTDSTISNTAGVKKIQIIAYPTYVNITEVT